MIDVPEIERVLTTMDAKRAKDSSAIWTIDQLVWPFGSRQKKLSAGKTEVLKLLIQSEVGAYLVIDEEDEMVRVPHAHRVERDCTWQLEPCIMLEDLQDGPLSYGSWSLYGAMAPVDPTYLQDIDRVSSSECLQRLHSLGMHYLLRAEPDETRWWLSLSV
jgi:hypothetical protein